MRWRRWSLGLNGQLGGRQRGLRGELGLSLNRLQERSLSLLLLLLLLLTSLRLERLHGLLGLTSLLELL